MKFIAIVIAVSICRASGVEVPKECDKLGVLIYEEIGCQPEYDNAQKCPSHYACKEYKNDTEHCNFQGRTYKRNEMLDNSITLRSCTVGCYCQGSNLLNCAILDCPEWLGGNRINSSCYRTYDLNKCCSTGFQCEPYDKIPTCQFEGNLYREGQKMYPKDRCYTCVCRSGFTGLLEEPYCRRYSCAFEKSNAHVFVQNCAPVYTKNDACCASGYACPDGNEKFEPAKEISTIKCKYGDHLLNVGDSFYRQVETYAGQRLAKCECKVPPLVGCFTQEQ